MKGILIDFEGIDGSGKRTQSILLQKKLTKSHIQSSIYSYPDYESAYGKIIKQFLDYNINLSVDEQFLLYLLDMIKDKEQVKQELKKGTVIIMDRYFFSTIAYQCANLFDFNAAKKIIRSIDLAIPSIVFYLDVPVDIALYRKREQKGNEDRFEKDILFLGEVKKIYNTIIKEYSHFTKWVKLNGLDSPDTIQKIILSKVYDLGINMGV